MHLNRPITRLSDRANRVSEARAIEGMVSLRLDLHTWNRCAKIKKPCDVARPGRDQTEHSGLVKISYHIKPLVSNWAAF